MSLVAYDNSDVESENEDEVEVKKLPAVENSTFLSSLPPPKNHSEYAVDIPVVRSTKSDKLKILLPSLSEFEEWEKSPEKKKIKPSEKGSGLFAVLPKPKHEFSFIPAQAKKVTKAAVVKHKPKVPKTKSFDLSDDEDEAPIQDFFSFSKSDDIRDIPLDNEQDALSKSESAEWTESRSQTDFSGVSAMSAELPPSEVQLQSTYNNVNAANSASAFNIDPQAMMKLCGRKNKDSRLEDIQFIDVNEEVVLAESRQMLVKNLTQEVAYKPQKSGSGPSGMHKRKHQITYLAHQAKENEIELKNQWAQNRFTKKQTQSKYGF